MTPVRINIDASVWLELARCGGQTDSDSLLRVESMYRTIQVSPSSSSWCGTIMRGIRKIYMLVYFVRFTQKLFFVKVARHIIHDIVVCPDLTVVSLSAPNDGHDASDERHTRGSAPLMWTVVESTIISVVITILCD